MRRVSRVAVEGLFGHARHSVEFQQSEPTIILAPNGAGKTHILRLTAAAMSLDGRTLLDTVYSELNLDFSDGMTLQVHRSTDGHEPRISMNAYREGIQVGVGLSFGLDDIEATNTLPPGISKIGPGRWLNERTRSQLNASDLRRRYGIEVNVLAARLKDLPEIADLCGDPRPIFIDTWRLDARADDSRMLGDWGTPLGPIPFS